MSVFFLLKAEFTTLVDTETRTDDDPSAVDFLSPVGMDDIEWAHRLLPADDAASMTPACGGDGHVMT